MPFPVALGLLGAGLLAKPFYDRWAEGIEARGRAQRFQGLDPGPLGGLLGRGEDPEPFNDDLFIKDADGGRSWMVDPSITPFDWNAQMIRSGLLAPEPLTDPYGIAELGEWGANQRQAQSDAAAMARVSAGEAGAMDRLRYETENQPVEPVEPMLDFSDPQALADYTNRYDSQQAAMNAGEDALDFMDQYTGLAEVTPGTEAYARRAEIEQRLKVSALPVMAQLFEAGAMSDEEQKFFMQLSGGDFASLYGDARGKATFEALLDKIEDLQRRQYQGAAAAGVNYLLDPPARRRQRAERPRTTTSPITRPYFDPRQ